MLFVFVLLYLTFFRGIVTYVSDADSAAVLLHRCPALISESLDSIQQCREVSEISIVQLLSDDDIPDEPADMEV